MGSAETKKLEKKGGKYIYECPKNCFTSYRVDTKYSVRNLVCRKCESKLVRRQPDISKENENDSDTPSIPLLDKNDPQKLITIGRDDVSSESRHHHQVILIKLPGRKQRLQRKIMTLVPQKKRMLLLNCNRAPINCIQKFLM